MSQDARSLAQAGTGVTETREEVNSRGRGSQKTEQLLATRISGIAGLTSYDEYRDPEQAVKKNRKCCVRSPLNVIVVQQYRNHDIPPDQWPVFLTNGPSDHPFVTYEIMTDAVSSRICSFAKGSKDGTSNMHQHGR